MKTLLTNTISLLLGASLTLAYAPYDLWWVLPLSLTGFFIGYFSYTIEKPTWYAWWFGLGWFGAGISWVHVSIADFGGLPLIASISLMVLLCGYLALYPALALSIVSKRFSPVLWSLTLPLIWLCTEWFRSWMLTGFPWLSLGYSQLSSPIGGWLPVIGETGVSSLLIAMCCGMAYAISKKQWVHVSLLFTVPLLSGSILNTVDWTKPNGEIFRTAIVQGNIQQALRWVPEQDKPTMDTYLNMTKPYLGHDLIVWPEAAIPKLESLAQPYLHSLDSLSADSGSALITGIVNYNFESGDVYNSIIAVGKNQIADKEGHYRYMHNNRYDKHHLLPVGEFVPFESWLRGIAPLFDLPMSSFTRGDYQQRNLVVNNVYISPALCFEIAFPRQVLANIYDNTQLLLTVSNDAWFGYSHGPAQHMQIAQVRAKEVGLPLVRATNNGISAFVDHKGIAQTTLPQFERISASDDIKLVSGKTPYRQFGDASIGFATILLFVAGLFIRRRTAIARRS